MKNHSSTVVLYRLIKALKIPVTRQTVLTEVIKHPHSSSLLAVSDLLDYWEVPNSAYKVTVNELLETKIPLPFVACLKQEEFVLVNSIDEKFVNVSNNRWKNHRLNLSDFTEIYQGSILVAQKDDSSGETDYAAKRRSEIFKLLRIPFLIGGLAIMFSVFIALNPINLKFIPWNFFLLTLVKTAGLITSILLLLQSIDKNNPFVHKFCGTDDNRNCNAILTSHAAKISEELSWSEVGFFYFAGTWLVMMFNAGNIQLIRILALINLLSLPYTFYSIIYQWRVAKQWCIFCCTIQAVLWLEFLFFLSYLSFNIKLPNSGDLGNLFIAILAPIILWVFIKPLLKDSVQLKLLMPELYRFKYNKDLFKNILLNEAKYGLLPEDNSIIIGNKDANHIITMVSNPYCFACSNTHRVLDDLIETRGDLKLQLVFLTRINSKELDKKVLSHFYSLKLRYDDQSIKKAFNDWYIQKDKDYDLWQANYPVDNSINYSDDLATQKGWCKMANVTQTPTLFIDGRRLPSTYRAEDIKYIL